MQQTTIYTDFCKPVKKQIKYFLLNILDELMDDSKNTLQEI